MSDTAEYSIMAVDLLPASVLAALMLLTAIRALRVHRYSRGHIVASLTVHGRGIYFSRTPDGVWWKLRLRRRRCAWPSNGEDPPDVGVREPRPPTGPGPASGARLSGDGWRVREGRVEMTWRS